MAIIGVVGWAWLVCTAVSPKVVSQEWVNWPDTTVWQPKPDSGDPTKITIKRMMAQNVYSKLAKLRIGRNYSKLLILAKQKFYTLILPNLPGNCLSTALQK
jgi:hypothetical protein